MYMCLCNPFTDKDVRKALESPDVRNTTAQVYKACSGGNRPECATCIHALQCMIVDHQSTLGVQKLKEDLPELTEAELIAAE